MNLKIRTTIVAGIFGGILGVAAAGVWAIDRLPEPAGTTYFVAPNSEDLALPPAPAGFSTTSRFMDFTPTPAPRLPVSLWFAIPVATAGIGAVTGAIAASAGVAISRPTSRVRRRPDRTR